MKAYLGMTADELENLCDPKSAKYFKGAPYWTSEIYGFGKYIREYGYYPSFLPLCIYSDHGVGNYLDPQKHEIESDAPMQFFHSAMQVKKWSLISKKPCFVLYSPFVYYRRSRNIIQNSNAIGTVAFPIHSTPSIDFDINVNKYIRQLLALPDKFHPVTVCLHMHDINKGLHQKFIKIGIPVVTAGNTSDYRFTQRFYEILRNAKYTTSNAIGSYTFYSIEMDIPFFILGEATTGLNKSDENLPSGKYDPYKNHNTYTKFYDLFKSDPTITTEKKSAVINALGIERAASRLKMSFLLYISLIFFIFSLAPIRWIIRLKKTYVIISDK